MKNAPFEGRCVYTWDRAIALVADAGQWIDSSVRVSRDPFDGCFSYVTTSDPKDEPSGSFAEFLGDGSENSVYETTGILCRVLLGKFDGLRDRDGTWHIAAVQ